MALRTRTLSRDEENFLFNTVFPGLDARRDDLDRDLFVLLARRLIEAGYTVDTLGQFVASADRSLRRN
jgi:hypothetical protein